MYVGRHLLAVTVLSDQPMTPFKGRVPTTMHRRQRMYSFHLELPSRASIIQLPSTASIYRYHLQVHQSQCTHLGFPSFGGPYAAVGLSRGVPCLHLQEAAGVYCVVCMQEGGANDAIQSNGGGQYQLPSEWRHTDVIRETEVRHLPHATQQHCSNTQSGLPKGVPRSRMFVVVLCKTSSSAEAVNSKHLCDCAGAGTPPLSTAAASHAGCRQGHSGTSTHTRAARVLVVRDSWSCNGPAVYTCWVLLQCTFSEQPCLI